MTFDSSRNSTTGARHSHCLPMARYSYRSAIKLVSSRRPLTPVSAPACPSRLYRPYTSRTSSVRARCARSLRLWLSSNLFWIQKFEKPIVLWRYRIRRVRVCVCVCVCCTCQSVCLSVRLFDKKNSFTADRSNLVATLYASCSRQHSHWRRRVVRVRVRVPPLYAHPAIYHLHATKWFSRRTVGAPA